MTHGMRLGRKIIPDARKQGGQRPDSDQWPHLKGIGGATAPEWDVSCHCGRFETSRPTRNAAIEAYTEHLNAVGED